MLRHFFILLGMFILAVIGVSVWLFEADTARLPIAQVQGRTPEILPARAESVPTIRIAEPVGWQANETPQAAQGLAVQRFADGLDHPRWLYELPNGDILVAETNSPPRKAKGFKDIVAGWLMGSAGAGVPSANRITLLRDSDGDGRADARTPFLTGLNSPFGMALVGDWLYVANTDALVRFPYQPGQTRITANPEKIVDLPGAGNHWTRNVIPAPGGEGLLVSVGSDSNIGENGMDRETNRAAILLVDPQAKTFRIFGSGLRNPVGMAIEPSSQAVWTVVNERDMLGSDTPPDYMTRVTFGDFYGWPNHYWGGYIDRRVELPRPDLREYSKRPDYALGPHTASLGLAFADGARLGSRFAKGAFIGQHGSWNRVPVSGYKVIFVPFADNGFPVPEAKPVDVLTGFLNEEGQARGRPVGVITDRRGGLLVADDVGNVIWRVRAAR